MTNRKTVVFCCNSLWGLLNFRGRVIQALAEDGHRVVLVAPPDVPLGQVAALGAEFVEWQVSPRSANLLAEVRAVVGLRRLYRRLKPDIAFQFTIKPVMYGAIVSWLTGYRCVSVITGLGYLFLTDNWKSSIGKLLYRLTLHRSHQVWFLNADDRTFFEQGRMIEGLTVVTMPGEGIDVERFAQRPMPPEHDGLVFLMVARLVKDKGVLEFAGAARKVKSRFPDATFRLLGPAYAAHAMSVPLPTVEAWSNEGWVDYLGAADDVRPAIADCHCVVLPSYREGMPRVLMEAAAMGRPAIATNVTGCRDVIVDQRTGLLCEVGSVDSLADACIELLAQPFQRLVDMAREAHAHAVAQFDDRIVIALYRRTIEQLSD